MAQRVFTLIDQVSASTYGTISIAEAERVSFQLVAADISSGTCQFYVKVSNDGSNWTDYDNLLSSTGSQREWVELTADGSKFCSMNPDDTFRWAEVCLAYNTDGSYSVIVSIREKK